MRVRLFVTLHSPFPIHMILGKKIVFSTDPRYPCVRFLSHKIQGMVQDLCQIMMR